MTRCPIRLVSQVVATPSPAAAMAATSIPPANQLTRAALRSGSARSTISRSRNGEATLASA